MNINDIKIVVDSSADMLFSDRVPFASAPLKIMTDKNEFVDDDRLDVVGMVNEMCHYKGRSYSSCPNAEEWVERFGDARYVFCVTITGALSGSYNSAGLARDMYEEKFPDRKVYVIDSLSTGPEVKLIVEKLNEYIDTGMEFGGICESIEEYRRSTGLIFMLESMRNLANNGRVSAVTAKAAGLLGIRVIGKASDVGTLEMLDTCRGEKRGVEAVVKQLRALGYWGGKLRIAHCLNESVADEIRKKIQSEFALSDIEIYPCRGICSFYAEKGGILVGFEKN